MKGPVMKEDAKRFWNNLKAKAQEQPLAAVAIAAMLISASAKLMDANTQRGYAKTHAKEVERRIAKQQSR